MTQPITLTLAQLRKLKPCDLEPHKPLFEGKRSVSVRQALEAGVSIPDLLWVAGELDLKPQIVTFAARVAREVAHLNPDPRVMAAIEAAEAWVREPSEGNREAAWTAWVDAAAAADAADAAAADAAAAAAAAAARAAWTAAWTAEWMADAAAADAAAARAARAAAAREAWMAAADATNAGLPEQRIREIFAEVFDPQTQETGR